MEARFFEKTRDYATIKEWWKLHGSFAPKEEYLSSTGLIVEEGKPVCAGWLYDTDSKICVFEFVICDPGAEKILRNKALTLLIEEIKKLALTRNYKLIYSSVRGLKYIRRLQKAGFIVVDNEMAHCFYEG